MRRRRKTIDVIGMPFLDMISCAFGGVVVLYLITPPTDASVEPFEATRIVELRAAMGEPLTLGMRYPTGGASVGCFETDCGPEAGVAREWTRGQGRLTAILPPDADLPTSLEIAVLDGPSLFTTSCLKVRAEVMGTYRVLALQRSDGFRRALVPFDDPTAPEEESC